MSDAQYKPFDSAGNRYGELKPVADEQHIQRLMSEFGWSRERALLASGMAPANQADLGTQSLNEAQNPAGELSTTTDTRDVQAESERGHLAADHAQLRASVRQSTLREVLTAIEDMEAASGDSGRTVSKGEIKKWLKYELGIGEGRNG